MSFSYSFTDDFKKFYKKLDPSIQVLIKKKIEKICEQPELGKPLHAPMQNRFSERVGKHRIIYTFSPSHIEFVHIDHRDTVYG